MKGNVRKVQVSLALAENGERGKQECGERLSGLTEHDKEKGTG